MMTMSKFVVLCLITPEAVSAARVFRAGGGARAKEKTTLKGNMIRFGTTAALGLALLPHAEGTGPCQTSTDGKRTGVFEAPGTNKVCQEYNAPPGTNTLSITVASDDADCKGACSDADLVSQQGCKFYIYSPGERCILLHDCASYVDCTGDDCPSGTLHMMPAACNAASTISASGALLGAMLGAVLLLLQQ